MRAPRVDYIDRRFGKLIVHSWLGDSKWLCNCDCGNKHIVKTNNLTNGKVKSCGCYRPFTGTHGKTNLREYSIWSNMKNRCYNKNSQDFERYGGRGIEICLEWLNDFDKFYKDMGPRPSIKYSIDRVDNSKGYSKSNCKWATKTEQPYNRRSNRIVKYKNYEMPLKMLCDNLKLDYKLIHNRITCGWSVKDAIEKIKNL